MRISSALMKRSEFNQMDHQKVMTAGQKAAAEAKDAAVILWFETILAQKPPREAKILKWAGKSGRWLSAIPNATSECCLNMQEWHDAFCMRYAQLRIVSLVRVEMIS